MKKMGSDTQSTSKALIEEFRVTGFSGREPAIAAAPADLGTRVAAARQLEVMASHIAAAWLDLSESEAWDDFIKPTFVPRLASFASIIDQSLTAPALSVSTQPDAHAMFRVAWSGMRKLISEFSADAVTVCKRGISIVGLLEGAMVVRQCAEAELTSSGAEIPFQGGSSGVAHSFFNRCLDKLGVGERRSVCGIVPGMSLAQSAELVSQGCRELCARSPVSAHQKSA
jgi:hypothetical protein